MSGLRITFLFFISSGALALPTRELVLTKSPRLFDQWLKTSDISTAARYNPDQENVYHLFTRTNPRVSQPLLPGNTALLSSSSFDPNRRTIYLIHGWVDSATGTFASVLVPAFLEAADVNVIVVDWSTGVNGVSLLFSLSNALASGQSGARFINWLNSMTGASLADYHIAGYSLGALQAGVTGRALDGRVPYITALDPARAPWARRFLRPNDAIYLEAIHTNSEDIGYGFPMAQVDFYPNGGINMPGCSDSACDHDRAFFFFSESITSGGFTGRECATYEDARAGTCDLPATLQMGGLTPKTGSTGLYHLETNAFPPFSQG